MEASRGVRDVDVATRGGAIDERTTYVADRVTEGRKKKCLDRCQLVRTQLSLRGVFSFPTPRLRPSPHSAPRPMPPKPSPPSAGKPSKRRASDASGLQQSDLRDAFGASPKHARRGSLSSEDPLEVQVTPRQYDAFTVKFLETEGTARGFSAADREEDSRRSGEARERRRRFAKRQADEPSLGSSGRRGGRAIFKSRVFFVSQKSQPALDAFADLIESTSRHDVDSPSSPDRDGVRRRVRRAAA